MRLFVITHGTKDFGDAFVVRENRDGFASLEPLAIGMTLEEARGAIECRAPSLVRLGACWGDDPVIVESWGSRADVDALLALQRTLGQKERTAMTTPKTIEVEIAAKTLRANEQESLKEARVALRDAHDALTRLIEGQAGSDMGEVLGHMLDAHMHLGESRGHGNAAVDLAELVA